MLYNLCNCLHKRYFTCNFFKEQDCLRI